MSLKTLPYAPIHCRSYFSLLKGCISPEEICAWAKAGGYGFVGMVDINNFYGLVRFVKEADRLGINPVAGVAIEKDGGRLFTAFCRSREGFARANRIVTRIHNTRDYDPVEDLVQEGWSGLHIVSARRDVLHRLLSRTSEHLAAGLFYGEPFGTFAAWAARAGIGVIALNEAVLPAADDARLYRLLRAIDGNISIDGLAPAEALPPGRCYAEAGAVYRYFSGVPEALAAALALAREADARQLLSDTWLFPSFEGLPEAESFCLLKRLCLDGVGRRYGDMRSEIQKRLDYELSVIRHKAFAGYFLVVQDIVKRWPRTCGRGSSAASIVSYLLGITHVDPLAYDLYFERFLNMGRRDPPDIDVDFPWDERHEVLEYVFERYSGSSGMVADHVTFGPRSCVRDPAKALGIEEREIERLVRFKQKGDFDQIPPYLKEVAIRLRGFPRHIGTHCGGVVITPGPITDYTHVQQSPLDLPVIAWEKDAAEDAGLVKIDLLGNRSLAVLRDSIRLVNDKRGGQIDWHRFHPIDEPATRALIERGDTLGVFYVESPATRLLLRKMGTGDFEHLVVASSIIRPAANQFIREYVRRQHGGHYAVLHPLLSETLSQTYDIMVYQEDISRVAMAVARFSAVEADSLRKVLSKRNRHVRLAAYSDRFLRGALESGVDAATAEKIWEMILSFEGYSFCKAHSASYALLSYKLAWMKRHHPLEFMASVINNGGGFYTRQVYLNAVRRMGFRILGPDVNRSSLRYTVEHGCLRIGLSQVKDVSAAFLDDLIRERGGHGVFEGYFDFLRRLSPRLEDLRPLIKSGCLDSLSKELSRPQMFWAFYHPKSRHDLFENVSIPACVKDYSARAKLLDEKRTLGLIISRHPVLLFGERVRKYVSRVPGPPCIDSRSIAAYAGRRIRIAGSIVTGKEVATKTNKLMSFLSFEDSYSIFETVAFPDVYERASEELSGGLAFLITGKVEEEFGAYQIRIEILRRLSR